MQSMPQRCHKMCKKLFTLAADILYIYGVEFSNCDHQFSKKHFIGFQHSDHQNYIFYSA